MKELSIIRLTYGYSADLANNPRLDQCQDISELILALTNGSRYLNWCYSIGSKSPQYFSTALSQLSTLRFYL